MPEASTNGLSAVGVIVNDRLEVLKKSQRWLATRVGISATLLNWGIQGKRPLNRTDLAKIAVAIGVEADRLLRAANFDPTGTAIADIGMAISARLGPAHVQVVTDPRFLDSALFVAICATQPLAAMDVSFEIVPTSWPNIPDTLATTDDGIAFFNRRHISKRGLQARLHYWSDLALYRGYSVLAKPGADIQSDAPLSVRLKYARTLLEAKKSLHVVTIGGDTTAITKSWLFQEISPSGSGLDVETVLDADFALETFLTDPAFGDLFIGGLPQRVRGVAEDCPELFTSADDPLLFSFNSLICSEGMLGRKDILYLLHAVWGEVVKRLYADLDFRRHVAHECERVLRELGVAPSRMSFSVPAFVQLFGGDPAAQPPGKDLALLGRNTEVFLANAAELTSAYLTIISEATEKRVERLIEKGEATADTVLKATLDVVADVRKAEGDRTPGSAASTTDRSEDRGALGAP